MFVVGVEDEEHVECFYEHGVDFVLFRRDGEHHVQEVSAVGEFVSGVDSGLADGFFVGVGGDGADFGEESDDVDVGAIVFGAGVVG